MLYCLAQLSLNPKINVITMKRAAEIFGKSDHALNNFYKKLVQALQHPSF
jgi:hypothetical protein